MTLPIGTAECIFALFSLINFFQAISPVTSWAGYVKELSELYSVDFYQMQPSITKTSI